MTDKDEMIQRISQEIGIPPESYVKIVKVAFETRVDDINDLELDINLGNFDSVHQTAHRLKGVFINLRWEKLFELVDKIDQCALKQKDTEEMKETLIELRTTFENLKNQFQ